jgi:hypothetical protein
MPSELDRLRPTLAAKKDGPISAGLTGENAGTRVEPISVPRPQPFDTVTIGVVTGRALALEFPVAEVKTRDVVRDDLVLGFESGGKVVLKDYMHAFGLLGGQRTTIIQPDGKHYAFTEMLAPTGGAKTEEPASNPDVVIVEKPGAGEMRRFELGAGKPAAFDFGKDDVARSQVSKEGDLVLTFKDRAVLVLAGCSALKDSADFALHDAGGGKVTLGELAPGAGRENAIAPGEMGPGSGDSGGDRAESGAAGIVLIVAPGMDVGGDVETAGGRWGAAASGAQAAAPGAAGRGWIQGHDGDSMVPFHADALAAARSDAASAPLASGGEAEPVSSHDVFDSGDSAPETAPAHAVAGAGTIAAAQDVAAVFKHAEHQAPPAQHDVMGHG